MADFETLFKSGADQSCFLAKPSSCAATRREEVASQERQAEQALLHYCSFPEVRRLPHQASIEAQSRAWLTDLYHGRLPAARVERLLDTRLETLGCVFYPHGSSDARSLTLNKLIHWFFVLDDVLDDPHLLGHNYEAARRFSCRHFKAMFGGDMAAMKVVGLTCDDDTFNEVDEDQLQLNVTPVHNTAEAAAAESDQDSLYAASLAKAQQDLVIEVGVQWADEMRDLGMSPRQLERLREAVAEYLAGIVGIVRLRQEKRLPSLDEYIRLRRMDGADKLALLGCEFDLGIELDDETLEHPLIKELHATTADQLLWLNDLLSFNREYHNEDYVSLLAVLHYNNHNSKKDIIKDGCNDAAAPAPLQLTDFQEAICEARAMIKAVDEERVRLASKIAAWKPYLQPYVQATHFTISGITFWTLWSQRYQRRGPI